MTTLYRPVLIESAEQAEALPIFTIATVEESHATGFPEVARKIVGGWRNRDLMDGRIPHADMVGWTALVPIEAEEERTRPVQLYISAVHVAPPSSATQPSRRLVTPWEEA